MRVGLFVLLDPEVGSSNRELSDHHTSLFVFETLQLDRAERSLVVLDGLRRIGDREPRCDFRLGQLSPRRVTAHTHLPFGDLLSTSLYQFRPWHSTNPQPGTGLASLLRLSRPQTIQHAPVELVWLP